MCYAKITIEDILDSVGRGSIIYISHLKGSIH